MSRPLPLVEPVQIPPLVEPVQTPMLVELVETLVPADSSRGYFYARATP